MPTMTLYMPSTTLSHLYTHSYTLSYRFVFSKSPFSNSYTLSCHSVFSRSPHSNSYSHTLTLSPITLFLQNFHSHHDPSSTYRRSPKYTDPEWRYDYILLLLFFIIFFFFLKIGFECRKKLKKFLYGDNDETHDLKFFFFLSSCFFFSNIFSFWFFPFLYSLFCRKDGEKGPKFLTWKQKAGKKRKWITMIQVRKIKKKMRRRLRVSLCCASLLILGCFRNITHFLVVTCDEYLLLFW